MVNYRRNYVPGGTCFFTVTLKDRGSNTLIDHIEALRAAHRAVLKKSPFVIDASVILPDHLHAIWMLPEDDADYSKRWQSIKADFSRRLSRSGKRGRRGLWQPRFWEHTITSEEDLKICFCVEFCARCSFPQVMQAKTEVKEKIGTSPH